jgi:prepilin-type N-terminal cleavage/methylation domain-containing protein
MCESHKYRQRAFSLIELLIALSVIAIVGAIVVPQYIGLQDKAKDVAAKAMADELNHTYANWVAAGGVNGSKAITSDVLKKLTASNGDAITHDPFEPITITNPDGTTTTFTPSTSTETSVKDSEDSDVIRTSKPAGADLSPGTNSNIVETDNGYLVFNPKNGTFSVFRNLDDAKAFVASISPTPPDQEQTISVSASTTNAAPGDVITLIASGGHNAYSWRSSDSADQIGSDNNGSVTVTLSAREGTREFKVTNAAGNGYKEGQGTVNVSVQVVLATPEIYYGTEIDKAPGSGEYACRVGDSQYIYIVDGGASLNDNPTFVISGLGAPGYLNSSDFNSEYALWGPIDASLTGRFNVTITRLATSKSREVSQSLTLGVYNKPTITPSNPSIAQGGSMTLTINDDMPGGSYDFIDLGYSYYVSEGYGSPEYNYSSSGVSMCVLIRPALRGGARTQTLRDQIINNPISVNITGKQVLLTVPAGAFPAANGYSLLLRRANSDERFGVNGGYLNISVTTP